MENEAETKPMIEEPSSYDTVDDSIGDPYCFESDHVALKNNPDYHKLLRTICVLEAQRAKAIDDQDVLYQAQQKVLKDPVRYVDHLQKTGSLGIPVPGPQKIAELPTIDWKKYTSGVDFRSFGSHRQSARLMKQHGNEEDKLQRLKNSLEGKSETREGTNTEGFVRGRFKDESKPATFNRLWTPEEQKLLDELLIKHPPRKVEAERYRIIAAEMKDRTPQQVASRVQKYFQKLEQNKLPVPGRVPNSRAPRIKKASHQAQRYNWMYRESTFLQKYRAPVMMKEDDDDMPGEMPPLPPVPHTEQSLTDMAAVSHRERAGGEDQLDEDLQEELQHTAEYRELKQLTKLREQRVQSLDPSHPVHSNFKCDRCGCAPIVGIRWHCVDCPSTASLDVCETCVDNLGSFETASHNSSHRVRPVKRTWNKPILDQDYMYRFNSKDTTSNYNYLDPNYMPAV